MKEFRLDMRNERKIDERSDETFAAPMSTAVELLAPRELEYTCAVGNIIFEIKKQKRNHQLETADE
jgi:hypothetical protein